MLFYEVGSEMLQYHLTQLFLLPSHFDGMLYLCFFKKSIQFFTCLYNVFFYKLLYLCIELLL